MGTDVGLDSHKADVRQFSEAVSCGGVYSEGDIREEKLCQNAEARHLLGEVGQQHACPGLTLREASLDTAAHPPQADARLLLLIEVRKQQLAGRGDYQEFPLAAELSQLLP